MAITLSNETPEELQATMEKGAQEFINGMIGSPTFVFDQGNLTKVGEELVALNLQPTASGYKIAYLSLLEKPGRGGLRTKEPVAPKPESTPVAKVEPAKPKFKGDAADRLYQAGAPSQTATWKATGEDKERDRQNLKKTMADAVQAAEKTAKIRQQRKEVDDVAIYRNGKLDHAATSRAKAELKKKYGL
jgi:hypothetical protein